MSIGSKRKILMAEELFSSAIGLFFQEIGVELTSSSQSNDDIMFAIDDINPEKRDLPRIFSSTERYRKSLLKFLARGVVNPKAFDFRISRNILKHYFNDKEPFNLVDLYDGKFKNVRNFKIHESLSLGFFIDTIVVEAYKLNFLIDEIRNHLSHLIPYIVKKMENSEDQFPLDVSYSSDGKCFIIQIRYRNSIEDRKMIDEDDLREISQTSHFFDFSWSENKKQAVFTSSFFKDAQLSEVHCSFFTEVTKIVSSKKIENEQVSVHSSLENSDDVVYEPREKILKNEQRGDRLNLAKKIFKFVVKECLGRKITKKAADLDLADIDGYLTSYPNQSDLDQVDDEVKHIILRMIVQNEKNPNNANDIYKIKGLIESYNVKDSIFRLKRLPNDRGCDRPKIYKVNTNKKHEKITGEDIEEIQVEKRLNLEEIKNQYNLEKKSLEIKLIKMKKVIDQLKSELLNRSSLEAMTNDLDDGEELRLKAALLKSMNAYKLKDNELAALKKRFQDVIHERDFRIELLEEKMSRIVNYNDNPKMDELRAENRSLLNRLEIAQARQESRSLNEFTFENEKAKKLEREVEILKSNLAMAQSLIERFKIEKTGVEEKLQNKLYDEKENARNLKDGNASSAMAGPERLEAMEKDELIAAMASDKKMFEEKYRAQSIEFKKLEQKFKYTNSQLETLTKKKGMAAKGNEAYIKQIDQMTAKAAEVALELGEKKKEIHKLKQDNFIINRRMSELEKKLAALDKKAS